MSQALPSVKIPKLNPIRLYNILNETAFASSFPDWVQSTKYDQVFSRFDILAFQIGVENQDGWDYTNTITCKAYDINETLAYAFTVNPLYVLGTGIDGYFYYEVRSVLTVLPRGVYQLRVNIKNYNVVPVLLNEYDFYSEPIFIDDQIADSVIFKYGHENNNLGLIAVDPDTFYVAGSTSPTNANQEYANCGTYNGQAKYRAALSDYLLFYATTLQGGSVWVVQANATTTPNESAADYAYSVDIDATYTNVGTWTGTIVVDYSLNYFYHRVYGGFDTNDLTPASKDVVYRDQEYDLTQLNSIPLDTTKLSIEGKGGVPNWQILIINRILSCSYMNISGRKYVKNDGAKLEKISSENYPRMGWKIELADETNTMANTYNGYDFNQDFYADFLINI